jgi:DDE superfamily endonuclease
LTRSWTKKVSKLIFLLFIVIHFFFSGIKLYRPPFLRGKKQFSAAECEETQRIAAARVHVERAIQRMKNYKLLSTIIRSHFFGVLDHIFVVISALVNLEAPILKDDKFDCDVLENNGE